MDANGALLATMQRYKNLVPSPTRTANPGSAKGASTSATKSTSTSPPTATASGSTGSNNALLLNELLGDLLISGSGSEKSGASPAPATSAAAAPSTASSNSTSGNPLADLNDIFSSALAESEAVKKNQPFQNASTLLEPQILSPSLATDSLANGGSGDSAKKPGTARKMPQIDMLSEELFQQILPTQERMASFKRDPEKVTLNDLARERMHVKPPSEDNEKEASVGKNSIPASDPAPVDDVPLLSETVEKKPDEVVKAVEEEVPVSPPVKPLSEIQVDLDSIQATGEQRIVLNDDDMQLSLNFTSDRPGQRVSVIVISAQNKSRQPVRDFQFEASVKKVC